MNWVFSGLCGLSGSDRLPAGPHSSSVSCTIAREDTRTHSYDGDDRRTLTQAPSYAHDARRRLELENGPEPDMVTEYVHDGQGNVVSELLANGA